MVVQGELDEHATPQHAVDIAEGVQRGSLWLIPEVKHMPPHEIPEVFNQQVLQFLADSTA
jgi:pimeloyl-ACP methyl ester carboxylesterase